MSDDAFLLDADNTMADQDVCIAVGEYLTQHYPNHPWMVGCTLQGGVVHIRLAYEGGVPGRVGQFGELLHVSTVLGAGGAKEVMRKGGDLLERYGLPRCGATPDSALAAKEHGLITDAQVK